MRRLHCKTSRCCTSAHPAAPRSAVRREAPCGASEAPAAPPPPRGAARRGGARGCHRVAAGQAPRHVATHALAAGIGAPAARVGGEARASGKAPGRCTPLASLQVVSCPHSSRAPLAPAPRALAPLPPRTPRWQPTRSFKRTPAQAQASTARRGAQVPFFPSAGNAALPQPQGARARLAPPQPPPRGGAAASAHALATAAARRGARAGRIGPKKRAASRSRLPARQEESLR